jgi:hypothetical protein
LNGFPVSLIFTFPVSKTRLSITNATINRTASNTNGSSRSSATLENKKLNPKNEFPSTAAATAFIILISFFIIFTLFPVFLCNVVTKDFHIIQASGINIHLSTITR